MSEEPKSRLRMSFRPAARKKASNHDDLVKLRGEVSDCTDEMLAQVGLTREQCRETLMAGLPEYIDFEIRIDRSGRGYYAYYYGNENPLNEEKKDGYFFGLREFDVLSKTMKLHEIKVEGDSLSGRASGVKAMRNAIHFCGMIGIDGFHFKAALGNGSYTWARFGMLPDYPLLNEYPEGFLEKLQKRFSFLEWDRHRKYPLSEEASEALGKLKQAIKMEKPEDLWAIADCRIPLDDIIDVKGLINAETLFDKKYRDRGMDPVFKASIGDIYNSGKSMTLGMYLLNSNAWESTFRIGAIPAQMARIEAYLVQKTGAGLSGSIGVPIKNLRVGSQATRLN